MAQRGRPACLLISSEREGEGKMVQAAADKKAIIATVMDYFEGWFDGNAERMARAVHPNLNKRNIRAGAAELSNSSTATQMIGWTRDGEGKAERPPDLAIKVRIDDVHEQIATVTVYSAVYIEYLHLVQSAGEWRIVNALYMRRNISSACSIAPAPSAGRERLQPRHRPRPA